MMNSRGAYMPCYSPLSAWKTPSGVVFTPTEDGYPIKLSCGQCIGCRLTRSRHWSLRCMHEASLHKENCFITLTYAPEHLPYTEIQAPTLVKSHFQKFMKRLRKEIYPDKVRYFMCGEYGSELDRPHYHALLFGFDFSDKYLWTRSRRGDIYYRSPTLERLWPFGFSTIGSVTLQSAQYVARYIFKKINGKDSRDWYFTREPEYIAMSRRPGIACDWINSYMLDVYPHDYIVDPDGKRFSPPRYYDSQYELDNPSGLEILKENRYFRALQHSDDLTPTRLEVRRACAKKRCRILRNMEVSNVENGLYL